LLEKLVYFWKICIDLGQKSWTRPGLCLKLGFLVYGKKIKSMMRKNQKLQELIQDAEKSGASAAAIISTTDIIVDKKSCRLMPQTGMQKLLNLIAAHLWPSLFAEPIKNQRRRGGRALGRGRFGGSLRLKSCFKILLYPNRPSGYAG